MPNAILEYDRINWQVFAVGVTASIIILYYSISPSNFPNNTFRILALTLGFAILTYSFMLILGYRAKRQTLLEIINPLQPIPAPTFQDENINLTAELARRLKDERYVRVKWLAEIILVGIGFFYIYSFWHIELFLVVIPLLIILIFSFISCLVNLKLL